MNRPPANESTEPAMPGPGQPGSPPPGETGGPPPQRPASAPAFNLPGSIVLLVVLCVAVHIVTTYLVTPQFGRWIIFEFGFLPIRYSPAFFELDGPTLWSPLTYSFLHGSWLHVGFNMIWLVAFGAPVGFRLGWMRTFALWAMTAIGAVILHAAIHLGDFVPVIGASGAVSGFMGAAARFGFRADRRNPRHGFRGPILGPLASLRQPGVLPFVVIWVALNYAMGTDLFGLAGGASIAWQAHIGGLATGFFAIAWLDRQHRQANV